MRGGRGRRGRRGREFRCVRRERRGKGRGVVYMLRNRLLGRCCWLLVRGRSVGQERLRTGGPPGASLAAARAHQGRQAGPPSSTPWAKVDGRGRGRFPESDRLDGRAHAGEEDEREESMGRGCWQRASRGAGSKEDTVGSRRGERGLEGGKGACAGAYNAARQRGKEERGKGRRRGAAQA